MFRRKGLAMVFGVLLALGSASAAAAHRGHEARHAERSGGGPTDATLRSFFGTTIAAAVDEGNQGSTESGDQGDENDQGSTESGDQGDQNDQGSTESGDQGDQGSGGSDQGDQNDQGSGGSDSSGGDQGSQD